MIESPSTQLKRIAEYLTKYFDLVQVGYVRMISSLGFKPQSRNVMVPDFKTFHESISAELFAIKDRVGSLINHWPTVGGYKEAVLKNLLSRHLPSCYTIGRGFVVDKNSSSTEIDILILDADKPVLFREGDVFIVTPDCVLGIIEVKTNINGSPEFSEILQKLSKVKLQCLSTGSKINPWTGVIVFDATLSHSKFLEGFSDAFRSTNTPIECLSNGKDSFAKYWGSLNQENDRILEVHGESPGWISYNLQDMAPSYFIGNLIDHLNDSTYQTRNYAWFPAPQGKQNYATNFIVAGETKSQRIF